MFSGGTRAAFGLLVTMTLAGCAGVQPIALFHDHSSLQKMRVQTAQQALESLETVDVLIKLDNHHLAEHIQAELDILASTAQSLIIDRAVTRFAEQYVALEASATIPDGEYAGRKLVLHGDIRIMFNNDGIVWLPQFFDLQVANAAGEPGTPAAGRPGNTLKSRWLEDINAEMARILLEHGGQVIAMDPMPLGILEVGASEARANGSTADAFQHLRGEFITAGAAILIEPSATSIALDLDFVPGVLTCPARVAVSRATFAREILDREPVGTSSSLQIDQEVNHFFTEIAGADRPVTIVHYWFADGEPALIEELEVQPSTRWRTWSSRDPDRDAVQNWRVIVVEKSTGCIIESMGILMTPDKIPVPAGDRVSARRAFDGYREAFASRAKEFSLVEGRPGIASIEARKAFIADVLNEALRDVELVVYLRIEDSQPSRFTAALEVLDAGGIECENRECRSDRECIVDYDECPTLPRDNSSCVTCLFRNPLNNRCVSEGQDPSCVFQREVRNSRLARNHESCIQGLQSARDRCERLRAQEIRSCEIEADSLIGACESNRSVIESLQGGGPIADIQGEARLSGNLRLAFSGFRYDEHLERLRMNVGLHAEMGVFGTVEFQPADSLAAMRDCIAGWHGKFSSLAFLPQIQGGLIGLTETRGANLVTPWSGVAHAVEVSPSPIESIFVSDPGMLADCQMGLTISQVSRAISGAQGRFFNGHHELAVQPLPTRFGFLPASVRLSGEIHAGEARIGVSHLSYRIGD